MSGVRKRVVNGKRTDLCDLLMRKFRSELKPKAVEAPALFQGHTRFATSSIANFDGCHPHQWLPPQQTTAWRRDESGAYVPARTNLETFITHNGDLDFFEWHGTVYPLDDVFKLLQSFLGTRRPAPIDSAGVAGLLDLLRCKGLWLSSVRYGYVFGGLENAGNLVPQLPHLWKPKQLQKVAQVFVRAAPLHPSSSAHPSRSACEELKHPSWRGPNARVCYVCSGCLPRAPSPAGDGLGRSTERRAELAGRVQCWPVHGQLQPFRSDLTISSLLARDAASGRSVAPIAAAADAPPPAGRHRLAARYPTQKRAQAPCQDRERLRGRHRGRVPRGDGR